MILFLYCNEDNISTYMDQKKLLLFFKIRFYLNNNFLVIKLFLIGAMRYEIIGCKLRFHRDSPHHYCFYLMN